MSKPLVSVIIPTRNRSEFVHKAVDSVLKQTDVDFELIIVDDASDDPPKPLYQRVESIGHRVLRQAHRQGPGPARNRGVAESKGHWLAFLDSDDHWLPGKLGAQLQSLDESGLQIGQVEEIWYRDGERVTPAKPHRMSAGDLFKRSLRSVCVSSSSVMLTRALWDQVGGFDEELFVCEDYELWLRVSAVAEFDLCPEQLVVKFGGHPDQLSRALPAMDRFRILGLLKNLDSEKFRDTEAAEFELARKLRILSKGSGKRGMTRVVELCSEITDSIPTEDWTHALSLARELLGHWPTEL